MIEVNPGPLENRDSIERAQKSSVALKKAKKKKRFQSIAFGILHTSVVQYSITQQHTIIKHIRKSQIIKTIPIPLINTQIYTQLTIKVLIHRAHFQLLDKKKCQ